MKDKNFALSFPEYSHLTDLVEVGGFSEPSSFNAESQDSEQKALFDTIFAPDPVTGNPMSDLAIVMSRDARPEVAQFIRDTLMSPVSDGSSIGDADFALDATKSRLESIESYATRLRDIVSKYNTSDNSDKK